MSETVLKGKYVNTNYVARYLGYHPETIRRAVREGKMNSLGTIGKAYVFDLDYVISYKNNLPLPYEGETNETRPTT